jgi:hypothetical protein
MNRRIVLADDLVVFTGAHRAPWVARLVDGKVSSAFALLESKPRIVLLPRGEWFCYGPTCEHVPGRGDTPRAAYTAWLRYRMRWE